MAMDKKSRCSSVKNLMRRPSVSQKLWGPVLKEKEKPCTIIQLRNETNALEGEGEERKKGEQDDVQEQK